MASDDADLTGRELGGYRVLRRLGAGGMAEVYLAEQQSLGRQVALKVLLPALARDAAYVDRFLHEARAAASLVHANIVQIYEVGQADGVHFIAQEYVRGRNLGELLARETALGPRVVLDMLRQVVAALGKAAEAGIVHRDLKPENILLSQTGEIKVADFGLARAISADAKTLTQVGVAMGTPLYMSPEQIEGRPVDARSDIYSLGVTSYHLLAGSPPHTGDTALAIAVQHLNATPRPLENARSDVPSGLARVVHRMIAKKPEQRYQSPAELLAELRQLASDAAQEGWGEAPDNWALGEWLAPPESRSQTTAELSRLMHENSRLAASGWKRGRVALVAALALATGLAAAYVTRPRAYRTGTTAEKVVPRESAWAQLFHANTAQSEQAWRAVREYFPDEDPYLHELAQQGLIRYQLLFSQDYAAALAELNKLDEATSSEPPQSPVRAFVAAGLCIAHQRRGELPAARSAAARLTSEMKDSLRRSEQRLWELLQSALTALGAAPV
jgi:serine/threonine-protein kinase